MQINVFDFFFLVFIYGRVLGYFQEIPVVFDIHPVIFSVLLMLTSLFCIFFYKEV
jgi:hypothetical protein